MPAEAKARIRINDLLTKSGWRFFADNNEPANVQLEAHVKAVQILSGFELARRHLGRGWRKFPAQRT